MTQLKVENAWVEFGISLPRGMSANVASTGGQIDTGRGVVTALREISFHLKEGDRLGLMGHNGAGKSTMLRMLSGAYPPTRGRVVSVGSISTLFNTMPGLNLDGTGRENLITSGLRLGLSRRIILSKMDEIVDFAELGDFIDLPVRIYSAGMMTRLGFSIATAVEPEILLLDEGLATGDAQFAQKAQEKMDSLISRSAILVIASHSEALLARMCNRCLLLEHGQVLADGVANELFDTYRKSVVQAARNNETQGLKRAYNLAMEMMRDGKLPPIDLEEQSLRYALSISPNDSMMWHRYKQVLTMTGKVIPVEVEASSIMAALGKDSSNSDLNAQLASILETSSSELSDELKERATQQIGSLRNQ
jgi:ABC-type polysaccharide/polyol phosphate transport system ATPase subunit